MKTTVLGEKGKIGILTLTGESNYGNRLQNYAMEQILRQAGWDAETIRVDREPYGLTWIKTETAYVLRRFLPGHIRQKSLRKKNFLFFNRNITQARSGICQGDPEKKIRKKLEKYDFLVYGSDQIWNPEFRSFSEIYLGKYGEKEKNIAISASLGLERIPQEAAETFAKGLARFQSISVREEAGGEAIRALGTGLQPEVTLDPTLLLSPAQWRAVERPVPAPAQYCLTCFLGEKQALPEGINCPEVDAGTKSVYGPGEFLFLVRNASLVATDSFHAVVFSLIFGKEVFLLRRTDKYSSMGSRFETLQRKTGILWEARDNCVHIPENALYAPQAARQTAGEIRRFWKYLQDHLYPAGPAEKNKK